MAVVTRTFDETIESPRPAAAVRSKLIETLVTGWTLWSIDPSSSKDRVLASTYANQKESDKYWYAFESIARFLAGNPNVGMPAGHMAVLKLRRRVRVDMTAQIVQGEGGSTM